MRGSAASSSSHNHTNHVEQRLVRVLAVGGVQSLLRDAQIGAGDEREGEHDHADHVLRVVLRVVRLRVDVGGQRAHDDARRDHHDRHILLR